MPYDPPFGVDLSHSSSPPFGLPLLPSPVRRGEKGKGVNG